MADLRKYSGDKNPTREAVHIESNRVEQDIRQLNAKRHIVKGQADPGIQAMKPVAPRPTIGPHFARRIGEEERLRGNPEGLVATHPDATRLSTYGTRVDGTAKGPGFFGELARTDEPEMFSTELSTSMTINGEKLLFPLLVPSLTAEEIAHLVDGGQPTKGIVEKALRHAESRLAAKQSPFAGEGEQIALPKSGDAEMREGYEGK